MERMGRRRRGFFLGTAALGGVFFLASGVDALKIRGMGKMRGIRKDAAGEQTKKTGAKVERTGKTLATPATETRLNVRDLRPGDILAARWADEARNGTPGFWNHLAIVGTDGTRVVEAQKSADGIATATVEDFLARYSDVVVFRFFDSETARRAAASAESRVAIEGKLTPPLRLGEDGKEKEREEKEEEGEFNDRRGWGDGETTRLSGPRYSWSASLTPTLRENAATENCVSLLRRAFWQAAGVDYRWKTPDDLARWDKSGDFAKIGRFGVGEKGAVGKAGIEDKE